MLEDRQSINDWVIIGLRHSASIGLTSSSAPVSLLSSAASVRQVATLTITVDIRSVHSKILYVTIQTIDESVSTPSQLVTNHPFAWTSASCQWGGKSRYEGVEVLSHDSASCKFKAHFLSPGVFDVNR